MKHFMTHKDNMPAHEPGYGQFSLGHFFLLLLSTLLIFAFVVLYAHAEAARKIFLLRSIAFTLIFIEAIKILDSIFVGNTIFPEMLLTLFLPAALMAILVPTTSTLPILNFYTIHQFLYHDLIIAYIAARFLCKEIPLTYSGVWISIVQILLLAGIIYLIDVHFDKNFMFLRDPYGNPLLGFIWKVCKGGFGYTLGLVAFCILMIHVFYFFFKLIATFLL